MKKDFVYPGVFHKNSNGSYTVTFPDLPGCISEGKSLKNAMNMSKKALAQWCSYLSENNKNIPEPSYFQKVPYEQGEMVVLIRASV